MNWRDTPRKFAAACVVNASSSGNRLGLTEQVPARLIYVTLGRSHTGKAGAVTIELHHRAPRKLVGLARMSATVFAALRNIGRANVTTARISHLREVLRPLPAAV